MLNNDCVTMRIRCTLTSFARFRQRDFLNFCKNISRSKYWTYNLSKSLIEINIKQQPCILYYIHEHCTLITKLVVLETYFPRSSFSCLHYKAAKMGRRPLWGWALEIFTQFLFYYQPGVVPKDLLHYLTNTFFGGDYRLMLAIMTIFVGNMCWVIPSLFYFVLYYFQPPMFDKYRIQVSISILFVSNIMSTVQTMPIPDVINLLRVSFLFSLR